MTILDPALLELAATQGSMLTTRQARSLGMGPYLLERLVAEHVLQHPTRGLYAVTALRATDPEGAHRQLCTGALLLYPDAVLSGVSAVIAHGLPVWGVDLSRPVLRRPVDRARGAHGIRIRKRSTESVETAIGPAVPVDLALVENAIDNGQVQGVCSADAALHLGLVSAEDLQSRVASVGSWPRSSRACGMVAYVDGRSESIGESRARVILVGGGLALVPQVTIRKRGTLPAIRVDFLVEGTKVVIEFDGKVKYAGGDGRTLWEEKRREDRLRRLGYTVVRIAWSDLENPGRLIAIVRKALRSAAA